MGPNGEIIMDYSIHDAKEAGFNKVVFIIRKDIFKEFEEIIGNRIKEKIDVEYVFQELDDLPEGFEVPEGRTKPWGTGQAVLCCKDVEKEPFVIINADDYYGKESFVKLHDFLVSGEDLGRECTMGMGEFILKNTLSDNGTVTRGVSVVDQDGLLSQVHETTGIEMGEDGQIKCDSEEVQEWISPGDKQLQIIRDILEKFGNYYENYYKNNKNSIDLKKIPNYAVEKIFQQGVFFKKECFSVEEEYRIALILHESSVVLRPTKEKLEFIERNGQYIPYINRNFVIETLEGIRMFPTLNEKETRESLYLVCKIYYPKLKK